MPLNRYKHRHSVYAVYAHSVCYINYIFQVVLKYTLSIINIVYLYNNVIYNLHFTVHVSEEMLE